MKTLFVRVKRATTTTTTTMTMTIAHRIVDATGVGSIPMIVGWIIPSRPAFPMVGFIPMPLAGIWTTLRLPT